MSERTERHTPAPHNNLAREGHESMPIRHSTSLIELGYVVDATAAPEPPPDRRFARRLLVALIAVLSLVTLAGSTRPRPHGLVQLWSVALVGEAQFTIVGDTVVVLGPDSRRLTSYWLATGRKRWSLTLPAEIPYLDVSGADGVLLLAVGLRVTHPAPGNTLSFLSSTVAVDAASGAILWRAPGVGMGWPATGTALLAESSSNGTDTARLRLVRLADGGTVWSRETPDVQRWIALGADAGNPDRVATISSAGDVWVLRLADGTESASGSVDWPPVSPERGDLSDLVAEGDALYVLHSTTNSATVTAYSDRTLQRLWRVTRTAHDNGFYPCGVVLCANGANELLGYDWRTGMVRWSVPGEESAVPAGPGLLITENGTAEVHRSLLDAATGRRLADLGADRPPWKFAGGPFVTLGTSRSQAGRTVVHWVDPRTGKTFTLGTIDGVVDLGCQIADRLLLCVSVPDRLTVTAVG